jgi:cell division septation protein DedD
MMRKRGVFDEEEAEQARQQRDTEVTLSTGMQLLLGFGLLLICGLCFGLGYAVGHRGGQPAMAGDQQSANGAGAPLQGNGSVSKPSTTAQPAAPPPVQNATPKGDGSQAASNPVQAPPSVVVPVAAPPASNPAAPSASQPPVRPALPPVNYAPPAVPSATQLMVQIAAVSHQEDAEVLVGALRKHGYAVNARRDPADNLIHVRIGPFNNRDEANRWRMKLLNDGYNAMIQP